MKTALRSYHPVPSLQKSDGNLQDAPRIKNCLKAALLPFEFKTAPPSSPTEIREKAVKSFPPFSLTRRADVFWQRNGQIPPTSVVNLIFVLSNASHALVRTDGHTHILPHLTADLLSSKLPNNTSSLLWSSSTSSCLSIYPLCRVRKRSCGLSSTISLSRVFQIRLTTTGRVKILARFRGCRASVGRSSRERTRIRQRRSNGVSV